MVEALILGKMFPTAWVWPHPVTMLAKEGVSKGPQSYGSAT